MRTIKKISGLILVASSILAAGCNKNDIENSVEDPDGTILITMSAGSPGSGFSCGPCTFFYDNYGNFNFYSYQAVYEHGSEVCSVGKVNGLNKINKIPGDDSGWATKMSAKKGYGYIVKGYYYGSGLYGGESHTIGPNYYGVYVVNEGYNSIEVKYYQISAKN